MKSTINVSEYTDSSYKVSTKFTDNDLKNYQYVTTSCQKCVELKYICEYCLSLEEYYDELPF